MSANRKLQTEIVQVLKKVEEGVLLFDDIWEKVYAAGQQSLKEKYEGDLKKEIKKLQRLRDQIKSWLGSTDIKDKSQLTEARKIIESKMEQFKVCEKDTKTKAYSKEGLLRQASLDPKEAEREEKRSWLNDCLESLGDLVDSIEADIEKVSSGRGKSKNKEQIEKFENRIKKNRWHISRLEQILKLIDNEDLDPSELDSIKDDVEYYIESAADDDGALGVDDEFDIYEELDLGIVPVVGVGENELLPGGVPVAAGPAVIPPASVSSSESALVAPVEQKSPEDADIGGKASAKKSVAAPSAPATNPLSMIGKQQPTRAGTAVPTPAALTPSGKSAVKPSPVAVAASPLKAAAAPVATAAPLAAKVVAAVAGKIDKKSLSEGSQVGAKDSSPRSEATAPVKEIPVVQSSWALAAQKVSSAAKAISASSVAESNSGVSEVSAPAVTVGQSQIAAQLNTPSVAINTSPAPTSPIVSASLPLGSAASPRPPSSPVVSQVLPPPPIAPVPVLASSSNPASGTTTQSTITANASSSIIPTLAPPVASAAPGSSNYPPPQPPAPVPVNRLAQPAIGSGSSLPSTNISVQLPLPSQQTLSAPTQQSKPISLSLTSDLQIAVQMLKQSAFNVPDVIESDRPTRNQYNTHPSFPMHPPATVENINLFEKLSTDSLFFAFYYQQGSYQQYLAAKQLKKHSWRYHKKYLTWFQRHEEPKVAGDEYEEGTYVYFDYESGWCQRIKSEFKFEYSYLEDELSAQS